MSFDFDDLMEHKTLLIVAACGAVIAGNFFMGGGQLFQQKQTRDASDAQVRDSQERAETLFKDQGCIAQAISSRTGTSNFSLADVAIDPISITPQNPAGTAINGGLICSTDGSLFRVDKGVVFEFIGTSPFIRKALVDQGFAEESIGMQRRAAQIYGGSRP